MEITLICASKQERLHQSGRVFSVELVNTEDVADGILDATFHFETTDPELAESFAINESYRFRLGD